MIKNTENPYILKEDLDLYVFFSRFYIPESTFWKVLRAYLNLKVSFKHQFLR